MLMAPHAARLSSIDRQLVMYFPRSSGRLIGVIARIIRFCSWTVLVIRFLFTFLSTKIVSLWPKYPYSKPYTKAADNTRDHTVHVTLNWIINGISIFCNHRDLKIRDYENMLPTKTHFSDLTELKEKVRSQYGSIRIIFRSKKEWNKLWNSCKLSNNVYINQFHRKF